MLITFYDGSYMECSEIEIYGNLLIVDGVREVPIIEVNKIECVEN